MKHPPSLQGELIPKILRRAVNKGLDSSLLFESYFARCSTAEQKLNIPEGVLKKEVKTAEQKAKDLEEDIRKKQEMLDKMQVSSLLCVYFLLFLLPHLCQCWNIFILSKMIYSLQKLLL